MYPERNSSVQTVPFYIRDTLTYIHRDRSNSCVIRKRITQREVKQHSHEQNSYSKLPTHIRGGGGGDAKSKVKIRKGQSLVTPPLSTMSEIVNILSPVLCVTIFVAVICMVIKLHSWKNLERVEHVIEDEAVVTKKEKVDVEVQTTDLFNDNQIDRDQLADFLFSDDELETRTVRRELETRAVRREPHLSLS